MAELTLVELYGEICDELALSEGERRRFWFAIAAEVERVAVALRHSEQPTFDEIARVCGRLGVPSVRELAAGTRRSSSAGEQPPRHVNALWADCPKDILVLYWAKLEEIVAKTSYKLGADPEETDTVESRVKEELFEDDCKIVRQYRHESSFLTYLTCIVQRAFADLQVERMGKWHFSACSERLGPLAKKLERMIYREGFSPSDAIAVLLTSHPEASRSQLEKLLEALPVKIRRPTKVSLEEVTAGLPASNPDILMITGERFELSERVTAIVQSFMETLADDERLLLQLLFESNMKISKIGERLKDRHKSLYRKRDGLLKRLREELLKAGIGKSEAAELYDYIAKISQFGFEKK